MKPLQLLLPCLLLGSTAFSAPALANEDETSSLNREIARLHDDISQSASKLTQLSQLSALAPHLSNSDNATILAALQRLNRSKTGEVQKPSPEEISAARNKISSYIMLCESARKDAAIFGKYCSPAPFQNLYVEYAGAAAK